MYRKFRTLAGYCLTDDKVDAVMAMVNDLDKLDDITRLTGILGAASPR